MPRILVLMSDTGGGHRASAEALRSVFSELYGDSVAVEVVDLWKDHTPWPINQMPKSYRFLATDAPGLYKLLWELGENERVMTPLIESVTALTKKRVAEVIEQAQPDLIVSVHPLLQEVPLQVLDLMGRRIPFVTVVTDLGTFHPTWFNRRAELCFVPNENAYQQALRAGLAPGRLRQHGLPIRPEFARPAPPKPELRRQLGLVEDLPAVLLLGGGEGMGPVKEIAAEVADRLGESVRRTGRAGGQMVVVCGRNDKLQNRLRLRAWRVPVTVNGFVTNMSDWMAACDCVITKAGPGTIVEAMSRGLPLVLSGYVEGQEAGNVAYVVENGIGTYTQDESEIASIVARWLGPDVERLREMSERARSLTRPQAVYAIVRDIAALLGLQDAELAQPTENAG